jgi:hypothetical protein
VVTSETVARSIGDVDKITFGLDSENVVVRELWAAGLRDAVIKLCVRGSSDSECTASDATLVRAWARRLKRDGSDGARYVFPVRNCSGSSEACELVYCDAWYEVCEVTTDGWECARYVFPVRNCSGSRKTCELGCCDL